MRTPGSARPSPPAFGTSRAPGSPASSKAGASAVTAIATGAGAGAVGIAGAAASTAAVPSSASGSTWTPRSSSSSSASTATNEGAVSGTMATTTGSVSTAVTTGVTSVVCGGVPTTLSLLRAVRIVAGGGGDVGGFGCAWRCPSGGSVDGAKIGDRTTRERGACLAEIGERTTCGRTSGVGAEGISSARRPSSMASVTHSFDGTLVKASGGKSTQRRSRSLTQPRPVEFNTVFFRSVTAAVALVISSCARCESGSAIWRTSVNCFHGIRLEPRRASWPVLSKKKKCLRRSRATFRISGGTIPALRNSFLFDRRRFPTTGWLSGQCR
mmetsp:Transcript_3287/g.11175  ORF Transcript_3287/g.11175 Transcript_3287/m.11175 type:complete len:326 (+) Transcript_3287:784-1761(+)